MTVVSLCCRFNTVCATTKVDRIHVVCQDFVLGLFTIDLDRQDRFFCFTFVRGGFARVVALNVLLSQR